MNFVVIDVETANANMASICQIGLVVFKNGRLLQEWKTYVDPEDYFDHLNIALSGIDESVVEGSPTFPELTDKLYSFLNTNVVVSHTHFDRVSLNQAAKRYNTHIPDITWLDSAMVVRRTWKEFSTRGYGLLNVCNALGYEFRQHDALEDAKAAAYILLAAIDKSGLDIDGWRKRVKQPICSNSYSSSIKRVGNPEGALCGEILVFTGSLEIPRREAADLAASIGCEVVSGVTKETTMLVVGDQDIKKINGHEKSSKHRKAEQLIKKGYHIKILQESDFKELVLVSG